MQQIDLTKTLEELENDYWDEPNFASSLVIQVHQLRKKPLCELNNEDLRLLIGQQMNLDYLLRIALEKLIQNPFGSGDLYIGDLFCSVLKVEKEYWNEHQELKNELNEVIRTYEEVRRTLDEQINKYRSNL
ncbi:contact-dependent growth inhibition system immunity protein [Paenibacillus amylolyticus]|uniref:contact-dependent growth inhibition system immunity protein n=1 Tax=Paenibacillus TaxID=44249 RepID=UPI00249A4B0E|nr:contact-dependent growth inhibition system immunity protein [Paenibacillus amylolyticus]WFA87637.1 contact-dependent growth inhibition system immunity protein [Paenibacillus amylolyticus]